VRKLRSTLLLAAGLLPHSKMKLGCLRLLGGWEIAADAIVAPVIFWRVERLRVGSKARLGPGSVYRDLRLLDLGAFAHIGQWNWITACTSLSHQHHRSGTLELGDHAAITSRHYVDCSAPVTIGRFTTIAGVRSTIFTHGIDRRRSGQTSKAVTFGDYSLVGSNVNCVPGSSVPDRCVIGMGATIVGPLETPDSLYVGCPARRVREVDGSYFTRSIGVVQPL
jgi:acetyltransferase-like isoleucine patch superfamily enzyme